MLPPTSEMEVPARYNVTGVGVSRVNLDIATQAVFDAVAAKHKGYVCASDAHVIWHAHRDPAFRDLLNNSYLTTPDGMPLVWMGKMQGAKEVDRTYGPDLMLKVMDEGRERGVTHFLYGGKEGVVETLSEKLTERLPGLDIVGHYTPPFRPLNEEELSSLQADIADKKPDIIWVGIGCPKQERFCAEHIDLLDTTLMFAVGAAFDFHSGTVAQAPRWIQRSGLEWLFRLCREPKRLWKRYLQSNPLFLLRSFLQLSRLKRYPLPDHLRTER